MYRRIIFALLVLVSFVAISLNLQPALAQSKSPAVSPDQTFEGKLPPGDSLPDGPQAYNNLKSAAAPGASTVSLGDPGFVLRPVSRYGSVTNAYIEDTAHLNYPYAVAAVGSTVWVADTWGDRAVHYSNTGAFLEKIGKAGFRNYFEKTSLDSVYDIATDPAGNIYLVDMNASHVAVFKPDGTFLGEIGQPWNSGQANDRLSNPYGVVADSAGRIYIADAGNCRIQVFQSNGDYLATLGETGVCGVEPNHFGGALRHMDIDGSNLYVSDASNHRVEIFDISNPSVSIPLLATIGEPGVSGNGNDHLNWPTGVAVDTSRIYVSDMHNQRIQIFNKGDRSYFKTLTGAGAGDTYSYPSDVAVDASGNLYVADNGHCRVVQYNSSQVYTRTFGIKDVPYITDASHFNRPKGVAVGPQGNIYLVEEWGCRLVVLDKNGAPLNTWGEAGVCQYDDTHLLSPNGVAVNPQTGEVYVADSGNNRIMIFSADGAYLRMKGSYGSSNDQFDFPAAVAIGSNGAIYVADQYNSRVQVFDAGFNYVATLAGFVSPVDLATDAKGSLYVLDRDGKAIQIYNQSLVHTKTIGGFDGDSSLDFGAVSNATALAVDRSGRIYVAVNWGWHLRVYDASGAFIGAYGRSGDQVGEMRQIEGMAVTPQGKLLVADFLNHNVDGLVQGVPHWLSTNLNGFGDPRIQQIPALAVYNNELFAGAWYNDGVADHADLFYSADGRHWTSVGVDFGAGVSAMAGFDGNLYVGTWNGKIWRSADGKTGWSVIIEDGFGNSYNGIDLLTVFNGYLYASTWNNTNGTQVWRSDSGDKFTWGQVNADGFGQATAVGACASAIFNNQLYFGTSNWTTASPFIVRSSDGTGWDPFGQSVFHSTGEYAITALAPFQGKLYALTISNSGTKVWSSADGATWQASTAFAVPESAPSDVGGLQVFKGDLYMIAGNYEQGAQVWRTHDGAAWEAVSMHGMNGPENERSYFGTASAVFKDNLYFALDNFNNGATLWTVAKEVYIPVVIR